MTSREPHVHATAALLDRPWGLAWRQAARLAHRCDRVRHHLPATEQPSLGARLRAAARAVPAHVAAGHARDDGERTYHLAVARGALGELEAQLVLARRLAQLPAAEGERLQAQCAEVRRLLGKLAVGL